MSFHFHRGGFSPQPVHDPISGTIAALAAWSTTGLTVAGISAATLGTAALGVGLSLGLNYAAMALRQNGSGPLANASASAGLNDAAIKFNERQAIPRKRIIYGPALTGGALFFEKVKPPYLYQGFLICAEQISAFRKMWIGTNEVAFNGMTPGGILTPLAVDGQPNYTGRLKVSLRLGLPSQTLDGLLAADFPELDASFRQRGIATVVVRYDYGADYDEFTNLWGQVQKPNPLFLVEGIAVPDPRIPGHILDWNPDDADSLAEARASWCYNDNATLCTSHYLTQRYGGRIRPQRIDWDKVVRAADWDDEPVYCNDGTYQKRYTVSGVVTQNQSPLRVVAGMIAANRGYVLESAGKVWPSSSRPRKPIATITDKLLTGAISVRGTKPMADRLTRSKVRFVAPDRDFNQADGPVYIRQDLEARGEREEGTLDLPYTIDHRRAQRLNKLFVDSSQIGKQITCRCDVMLLAMCEDELIGNVVRFESNRLFKKANGVYLVVDWGFSDGFAAIDLVLVAYDAALESNWIAANDEKPFDRTDFGVAA